MLETTPSVIDTPIKSSIQRKKTTGKQSVSSRKRGFIPASEQTGSQFPDDRPFMQSFIQPV